MIDELVEAGVEMGDHVATREEVARYASDYTGEFMLLYGQMKRAKIDGLL